MFKNLKLWLGIIGSLRVYLKSEDLIIKIRGAVIVITDQDILINSQRYVGFNSSLEDILKNQQGVDSKTPSEVKAYTTLGAK